MWIHSIYIQTFSMNDKNTVFVKIFLTLLLSVTSPLSAEKLRERNGKMPSTGILVPCLRWFSPLLLPSSAPPKEIKEQMYTLPCAWSATCFVSQS